MKTYIALLRGINVGGHRKIKMDHLKAMLEKMGFQKVVTYIQSGNVVFRSSQANAAGLVEKIEKGIAKIFGFDVPVLVLSKDELLAILQESPFKNKEDIEANRIYYVLLKSKPNTEAASSFEQNSYPNELFVITDNCVYLKCLNGAGKAKLNNASIERKLGVEATTRNHRTLLKLIELS
jgi:uncharacterized protein (DUF1697 family)